MVSYLSRYTSRFLLPGNSILGTRVAGHVCAPSLALLHTFHRSDRAVKLAYSSFESANNLEESLEEGSPIIIQHGLLGSRRNWNSLAKAIHAKTKRKIIVLDARNHGDSPHCQDMDYDLLSDDVLALMQDLRIKTASLVGHSMGGRTMMAVAMKNPSLVESLVVVDISPVHVSPGAASMEHFLKVMEGVDLTQSMPRSAARKMVDDQLAAVVKDNLLRQFLLTNLIEHDGRFRWRVNLRSVINNLKNIIGEFPFCAVYSGPTLFIGGALSDYIKPSDHDAICQMFPMAQFEYIEGAGHWVHSEKPAQFLELVINFIARN